VSPPGPGRPARWARACAKQRLAALASVAPAGGQPRRGSKRCRARTLIAKNHDEVEELRRLGERDYYEFTINKKNTREKVGNLMVELHSTNNKKSQYNVTIFVDDQRHDKKSLTANEPLYFFQTGARAPLEFVVNSVGKDKIVGYLSVPKANTTSASTSTNSSGN